MGTLCVPTLTTVNKRMKLSVIFPVFNQFELATAAIELAIRNLSGDNNVEVVILDNGSPTPYVPEGATHPKEGLVGTGGVRIIHARSEKNTGVYPTFWEGLHHATGDVIAFFHSDLMVAEKGWDTRVLEAFEADPTLGMMGFIGSNEIDSSGGRGAGTCSNFQGGTYTLQTQQGKAMMQRMSNIWKGSPAEAHGRRITGLEPAAVVDGCSMIFRRSCLEAIPQRPDFPPHHFYDRLLSCETREKGFTVAVLGIECDHISGQTVNQEPGYSTMAQEWAEAHGLTMEGAHNWDTILYRMAELMWLKEYRDLKRVVPCRV